MLTGSLKMESRGHWGSGAYARLMSQLLQLWLSCWPVADPSSRLNNRHPGPRVLQDRHRPLVMVARPPAFFTFKGTNPCPERILHFHDGHNQSQPTSPTSFTYKQDWNENSSPGFALYKSCLSFSLWSTIWVATWICAPDCNPSFAQINTFYSLLHRKPIFFG